MSSTEFEIPRDAAYLDRCLKSPGASLVRDDDRIPVRRAVHFHGTYVDVSCVKEVGVSATHPSTAACQRGGSCSSFCRRENIFIRYESKGLSRFEPFTVRDVDLIPELIARIKREVEQGTDTVINPERMLRNLRDEVGLRLEEQRGAPSVATPFDEGKKQPGMPRFIHSHGGPAVNVNSVTHIEYVTEQARRAEAKASAEGERYFTSDAVAIRSAGSCSLFIDIDGESQAAGLIRLLAQEITSGTDPLIDPKAVRELTLAGG